MPTSTRCPMRTPRVTTTTAQSSRSRGGPNGPAARRWAARGLAAWLRLSASRMRSVARLVTRPRRRRRIGRWHDESVRPSEETLRRRPVGDSVRRGRCHRPHASTATRHMPTWRRGAWHVSLWLHIGGAVRRHRCESDSGGAPLSRCARETHAHARGSGVVPMRASWRYFGSARRDERGRGNTLGRSWRRHVCPACGPPGASVCVCVAKAQSLPCGRAAASCSWRDSKLSLVSVRGCATVRHCALWRGVTLLVRYRVIPLSPVTCQALYSGTGEECAKSQPRTRR